jgi:hypothetical protein
VPYARRFEGLGTRIDRCDERIWWARRFLKQRHIRT